MVWLAEHERQMAAIVASRPLEDPYQFLVDARESFDTELASEPRPESASARIARELGVA